MAISTLQAATAAARRVADDVLFPAAAEVDQAALVPRSNLEALGDAGLHGLYGPAGIGLSADQVTARPVVAAVSGGCGATSFVWQQHHGAVRRLASGDGPAAGRWLRSCCEGSVLAGIGFAYLRRPGPPLVRATRAGDGWRIDGRAPWITGWGLIDLLVLMARAEDGSVVTVALNRLDRPEFRAGPPQRLAVLGATGTVALEIDGLVATPGDVVAVQDAETWARGDAFGAAFPGPGPLGIAERAIRLLTEADRPDSQRAAERLSAELAAAQVAADEAGRILYSAARGEGDAAAAIANGVEQRERGLAVARGTTDALVAATGGGGMALSHPAQRLSREATFYLVQAQSADLRAASLGRLSG